MRWLGAKVSSDRQQCQHRAPGRLSLLAYCDNMAEPLAGMLRKGSVGSNTVADHLQILEAAIAALAPAFRRTLMVTCDGAGASHGLITRLDTLAARRGLQLTYSIGWELSERERRALAMVPSQAWQIAVDGRGQVRVPIRKRLPGHPVRAPRMLGGGSARHRADRAAARKRFRRPSGRLARHDADLRPP
jgi:hypothetical protein